MSFNKLEPWMTTPEQTRHIQDVVNAYTEVENLIALAFANGRSHHSVDTLAALLTDVKVLVIGHFPPNTRVGQGHNLFTGLDMNGDYIEPYLRCLSKIWCDVGRVGHGVDEDVAKVLFRLVFAWTNRVPM